MCRVKLKAPLIAALSLGWAARASAADATLTFPDVTAFPSSQIVVPLDLLLTTGQVFSADITVDYNSTVLTALSAVAGSAASGFTVVSNLGTPGEVKVAMASATPLATGGELLRFTFDVIGENGSYSPLTLVRGDLNEGAIPAQLVAGSVTGAECGKAIVEAGEQCDDGNTVSGDCCDSNCIADPEGTACDDGNPSTAVDQCDGLGHCVPTLSDWGIFAMSLVMFGGVLYLRRRLAERA